jgi:ADP-ribose pyrophosphatase YjhB (NUDIX family)
MTTTDEGDTPMTTVTPESDHLTASAVVVDPEAKAVLLIHHLLTGRRQFPGGHLDSVDEPLHLAAVREVAEETGLQVTLWQPTRTTVRHGEPCPMPIDVRRFVAPADPEWGEPAHHHTDHLYLATADSTQELTAQLNEVSAAVWVPITDLAQDPAVRPDVLPLSQLALSLVIGAGTPPAIWRRDTGPQWADLVRRLDEAEDHLDDPDPYRRQSAFDARALVYSGLAVQTTNDVYAAA